MVIMIMKYKVLVILIMKLQKMAKILMEKTVLC